MWCVSMSKQQSGWLRCHDTYGVETLVHPDALLSMKAMAHVPLMRLVTFIQAQSQGGRVQREDRPGFADFAEIIAARPDNYRFAVVQVPKVTTPFWAVDLYDTIVTRDGMTIEPGWYLKFPTEAAAIMAAITIRRPD